MQINSIGIDLGKTTFHLIALGSRYVNYEPPSPAAGETS